MLHTQEVTGSSPVPPTISQIQRNASLLTQFLKSRREGISPNTISCYSLLLIPFVSKFNITSDGISSFLASLTRCYNGKANYHRAITTFIRWLVRMGHLKENPLDKVDRPKCAKRLLPAVTEKQVKALLSSVDNIRDKTIISLLFDSGMRLSELANIKAGDIDFESNTVTIIGKGNKQRRAAFTERTGKLLELVENHHSDNIWGLKSRGIQIMLRRLSAKTGIVFSAHAMRRDFSVALHQKGLSTLDVMRLGGWEDLSMPLRYAKSYGFEDSLKHYRQVTGDNA